MQQNNSSNFNFCKKPILTALWRRHKLENFICRGLVRRVYKNLSIKAYVIQIIEGNLCKHCITIHCAVGGTLKLDLYCYFRCLSFFLQVARAEHQGLVLLALLTSCGQNVFQIVSETLSIHNFINNVYL